jgi:hypothetical protein
VRNALREIGLGSAQKVSKLALSAKNVNERLEYAKIFKDWTERNSERVILVINKHQSFIL